MNDWEVYTIKITHETERNPAAWAKREEGYEDTTQRFETELYNLIKKYQGRAGLQFDARTSEGQPIVEY